MSLEDRVSEALDAQDVEQPTQHQKSSDKGKPVVHRKAFSYHVAVELQGEIDRAF